MHMTLMALIIAIIGLISSFFLIGIIPCIVSLILGIKLFLEEKTIENIRIIAISVAGIILPVVMYLNTYGAGVPSGNTDGVNPVVHILSTNYSNIGLNIFSPKSKAPELAVEEAESEVSSEEEIFYYTSKDPEELNRALEAMGEDEEKEDNKENSIFESLDSISESEKNKGGIVSIGASDDDMPSYGGLPVGTMLIKQYFREDDHNCNPVLVLQNKTGETVRYECRFIARDAEGEEMAVSQKTVEAVRDGALFVFEGRFDKRELNGGIPDSFEFSITKREPYENEMADHVSVYTKIQGSSAFLTAENKSEVRVKVDAYVLFFDGSELVDCMWMIPQNTGEVCLEPGSTATIQGDAYYRFDRVETFYTAYEAVGD